MLKDFEMICHHFPKNEDITILPVSDGGYAAEKLLLPSTPAAQEIILRGNRKAINLTMEDA